ncbi:MAG TPA: DUF3107 domain-containing protein [Tetrasphaera sp.]|jgi:hypothetical protein|uniref:DUF3107 domain-containing protein n=1 Tax=Nostocoides vanveenii TaxID=330835 RepID=A0ABP4W454_9MICO|nr:DUF3107 domain-containing protein [Tetrasphaera sp.]HNQ08210.1 DUF3107 domain-containing protein [Tetrasphaera sp.]
MEIKIGIANVAREVVIEPELTALEVEQAVTEAVSSGGALRLEDARGRVVIVPAAVIGYVDIGESAKGRVGFGT